MIQLTKEFHEKIRTLVTGIKTEVAGWMVGDVEEGVLVIKDLIVPDQVATMGDVEFDEEDFLKLRTSMSDEEWSRVVGHWHSHHTMGCFWSGTDETLIEQISKTRKKSVFIVSSSKNGNFESLCRVVLNEPFRLDVNEVPFEVLGLNDEMDEFLESAKSKIKEPKTTYVSKHWQRKSWTNPVTWNMQQPSTEDPWDEPGFHADGEMLFLWNFTKKMKKDVVKSFPTLSGIQWKQDPQSGRWEADFMLDSLESVSMVKDTLHQLIDEYLQKNGNLDTLQNVNHQQFMEDLYYD